MRQYYKIKERHPNAILLFRMGDFYETFDEDAHTVSRVLGITLTKRANGQAADVPLAGFPHHALDNYLPKLVRAGYRVAICEQLEDPKYARKVVKRDVVEVVTPGVAFHDQLVNPRQAHYLAAVHFGRERGRENVVGFAFIDATTGEFSVTEAEAVHLESLLETIGPAEVLVEKGLQKRLQGVRGASFVITPLEDWVFGFDFAYETLLRHFKTHSLKGFGVDDLRAGLVAAGAALHYLGETQKGRLPHIRRITRYAGDDYMALDPQTKRNLELVAPLQGEGREGTLVHILDETLTAMGARLLRKWLVRPLRNVEQIQRRLDAVEALFQAPRLREKLREELRQVGDLERLAAKVCTGRATPRDLHLLKLTLRQVPALKTLLADERCATLRKLAEGLTLCQDVVDRIEAALVDDPPATLKDGGLIRPGYNEELDELRRIASSGKDWVARMQKQEAERTGIPSLKVGFNKVFGYYLEITNAHKDKVPDDYIRKQTLVNAERYITPALKEYEEKILTAEEKIVNLEAELFNALRLAVAEATPDLQRNATLLALLDGFCALAEVAERYDYTRPDVHEGTDLDLEDARHPVVERTLPAGEPFIPNSIRLDPASEQILIITGPNMAGKSVVLRQVGLIVLLAQIGSFVPARRARVGIVDRIFTRVGASDNLAAGESTFLVEMNETANILNNATPRSLILLDEVGRGTSTFDGLSIAWALVEYLHENPQVAARTLFATHYHELNELADRYPRVRNFRIQVQEHEGKVIFLRKLVPGGADHSYGIEVARMAGLPEPVIRRAREILHHLESQHLVIEGGERSGGDGVAVRRPAPVPAVEGGAFQMSLFAPEPDPKLLELRDRLRALDPNRLTPIEALLQLAELKRLAGDDA
ncbi:MAG: DNA mismatch repair protein MutS [Bacteroidetes bacterium]|nr:MAG: DNA mismatch repair protein MutS [Bacteroidota bacterium]